TMMKWYASQVAYLLDKLDSIPEGDGTVLDHTIVYWTSELGNPAMHDGYDVPMILAGGTKIFRMGRFLTVSDKPYNCTGPYGSMSCSNMVPHNQLLVSIQNAFGIQGDTFGDPDYRGALANLT